MDTKYDRFTSKEFATMMKDPEQAPKFKEMIKSLNVELAKLPADSDLRTVVKSSIDTLSGIQKHIDAAVLLPPAEKDKALAQVGFELFNAMSTIANKAADNIKIT